MSELDQKKDQARESYQSARDKLAKMLASVPDDRLNWSPSGTARTPVALGAHCATALGHIHGMLRGEPYPTTLTEDADVEFREEEAAFTTREQVMERFDANGAAYLAWLDGLGEEQLQKNVRLPFRLGRAKVGALLGVVAQHVEFHMAQLQYLQTCYGDRRWR